LAYNENCPLTVRENNRNTSWWNQDLAVKRRKVRRLFNVAKKSGKWADYKKTLTVYNKALRQAKRELWRRHCEEIDKVPDCARLQRIISKDGQGAVSSLQLENGEYTTTEKGTLEELRIDCIIWVHCLRFPTRVSLHSFLFHVLHVTIIRLHSVHSFHVLHASPRFLAWGRVGQR
jgi:hypothetical protein